MTGGRYHIETSALICFAKQWTSFYMITASVMKELNMRNSVYRKLLDSELSATAALYIFIKDLIIVIKSYKNFEGE